MKFELKEIDYYTVQKTNNKGADQPAHMHRLVCVFVIHIQHSLVSRVEAHIKEHVFDFGGFEKLVSHRLTHISLTTF